MGKTKILTVLCVLTFMLLIPVTFVNAQTVSKKANGKTYVYDSNRNLVYNRDSGEASSTSSVTEGFYIKNFTIVADVFKNILTSERIKELKKDLVAVMFDCNVDGSVKSIKFLFTKSPFLTVQEIEKLESAFINQRFDISTRLQQGTIISFTIPCFFSRIQKEY